MSEALETKDTKIFGWLIFHLPALSENPMTGNETRFQGPSLAGYAKWESDTSSHSHAVSIPMIMDKLVGLLYRLVHPSYRI